MGTSWNTLLQWVCLAFSAQGYTRERRNPKKASGGHWHPHTQPQMASAWKILRLQLPFELCLLRVPSIISDLMILEMTMTTAYWRLQEYLQACVVRDSHFRSVHPSWIPNLFLPLFLVSWLVSFSWRGQSEEKQLGNDDSHRKLPSPYCPATATKAGQGKRLQ